MKLANLDQLADILGVSLPTLRNYIKKGLPYLEKGTNGKPWLFDVPDAVNWYMRFKIVQTMTQGEAR